MATKKQLAIQFITETYKQTGTFPSLDAIASASGSTKSTVQQIAATMRDVLGVPPTENGLRGRESLYEGVIAAAKEGTLASFPARPSTIAQHLNKALKEKRLVKVLSYR